MVTDNKVSSPWPANGKNARWLNILCFYIMVTVFELIPHFLLLKKITAKLFE